MAIPETETARAVRLALDRHQLRREQGIPTLSVLIGAAGEATAIWREWAEAAGWRNVAQSAGDDPTATQKGTPETAQMLLYCEPEESAEVSAHSLAAPGQKENAANQEKGMAMRAQPGVRLAEMVDRLWRTLNAADADQRKRPLALAVTPEAAARFLGDAPLDRARTFFAEGVVILKAADGPGLTGKSSALGSGVEPSLVQTAPSLSRQTLRPATVAGFDAAQASFSRIAAGLADAEETDRARSAAERFLADLLDELPETRGLFELNAPLDFCFGVKRAEVDLLAAGLKLAVEIDGYYHFRDPEGYRRDRRKDALLQRRGYLVLRFLAEDVVSRLEEILEEIRATVAFRRATRG